MAFSGPVGSIAPDVKAGVVHGAEFIYHGRNNLFPEAALSLADKYAPPQR